MISAFHLPKQVELRSVDVVSASGRPFASLAVSDEFLLNVIRILRIHRAQLTARPVRDIAGAIGTAASRWSDPDYELRKIAEEYIVTHSRFSRAMAVEGIQLIFRNLSREFLLRSLDNELGDHRYIDGFTGDGKAKHKIFGPELTALICAGNIPGVSLVSLAQTLLLKSSIIVRTSASDPLLPVLFAHSLREVDDALGDCISALWWDRTDSAVMKTVLSRVDGVIAYGSDETIENLRGKTDKPFIGFGHRVSLSFVAKENLASPDETVSCIARDVSLFDQHGCLSPHVVYVEEGGAASADMFAGRLAGAMRDFAAKIPVGKLALGEAGQIMQIRGAAEFRHIAGKEAKMWASESGAGWTVIYEKDPAFVLSCLNRTVWVKPLKSLTELHMLLLPWRRYLQAAGIAAPADRREEIADVLGSAGVNRICPVGTMQNPGPEWHHDGMNSLCRLIRWVDIEGFEDE